MTTPESRPWPYDIPRPPLLAGIDLISVPEAVEILGKKLHRDAWPDSWRLWWPPRSSYTGIGFKTVSEWDVAESHWRDGGADILENTIGSLAALAVNLTVRAVAVIEKPVLGMEPLTERRVVELGRAWELWALMSCGRVRVSWMTPSSPSDDAPPLSWWSSRLAGHPSDLFNEGVFLYLVRADVEAVGPKEAADAAKTWRKDHRRIWNEHAESEALAGRTVNAAGLFAVLSDHGITATADEKGGETWVSVDGEPLMKWVSLEQAASRLNSDHADLLETCRGKSGKCNTDGVVAPLEHDGKHRKRRTRNPSR